MNKITKLVLAGSLSGRGSPIYVIKRFWLINSEWKDEATKRESECVEGRLK